MARAHAAAEAARGEWLAALRVVEDVRATLVIACAMTAACSQAGVSSTGQGPTVVTDCTPGIHEGSFGGQPVRIRVPRTQPNQGRLPAVIVLHGSGDDGPSVAHQTDFESLGRSEGFITVFPTAPNGQWPLNDQGVAHINDLAASLSCADPARIYLTGFSRGSAMTFRVACTSPTRRFAAFGGVAFPDYLRRCGSAPPTAWIYFHGLKDATVSYTDGYQRPDRITPPARVAMRRWARHNGCAKQPVVTSIGADVVLRSYRACVKKSAIKFYTITDGDHQWPFQARPNAPLLDSGQSWAGVGATDQMWKFFARRSLT